MFVYWWQGRGFLTALIFMGAVIVVGMVADTFSWASYTPAFWAGSLLIAAPTNWIVGRHLNAKRRKTLGFLSPWKQLTYRARHKFMSLPMESWSLAMLIGAAFCCIDALFRS